jgi:hypothetical protein
MNVEVLLPYGGDLSLDETGDLVLIEDDPQNPAATIQRLNRLILQSAILYDDVGNPISVPDDIFNPTVGANLTTIIGEMATPSLFRQVQSQVTAALYTDPYVASQPPPSFSFVNLGNGYVAMSVSVYLTTGVSVALPTIQLPISGAG